ncbi:MAG: hypothetical protein Q8L51_02920 [Candidatus Amesbacteria bacterium]|nr:hypothetical protein [Candidatus Amesbacteria bacterium]
MSENRLPKIKDLQKQVWWWFWLSSPWGIGALVEISTTIPKVLGNIIDGKNGPFPELVPFLIYFSLWLVQYERAEHKLIEMEWQNLSYAKDHDGILAVEYGRPEKFIAKFNLMHIKLRRP